MNDGVAAFEERLGYRFTSPDLLAIALTHPSAGFEAGGEHYQRLEFLGDAVLGMLVAERVFRDVDAAEGRLSKLKSYVVSAPVLARHARRLGVPDVLRLGVGEERSGGREKDNILADALEAVIAAVYLDGGLDAVRTFVRPFVEEARDELEAEVALGDAKTSLQELLQARGRPLPVYELVGEEGPDHDKTFTVACRVGDDTLGQGRGSSKKRAEKAAAAAALAALAPPAG